MNKKHLYISKRDIEKAARTQKVARKARVSTRQVRRVLDGEQENDLVIGLTMFFIEKEEEIEKEAEQWVTIFNKKPKS